MCQERLRWQLWCGCQRISRVLHISNSSRVRELVNRLGIIFLCLTPSIRLLKLLLPLLLPELSWSIFFDLGLYNVLQRSYEKFQGSDDFPLSESLKSSEFLLLLPNHLARSFQLFDNLAHVRGGSKRLTKIRQNEGIITFPVPSPSYCSILVDQ